VAAAGSAAASGSSTEALPSSVPGTTPDQVVTRANYRALLRLGLAPDEAANVTAFMCGLPVTSQRWTWKEVNRLLFLRELQRNGRVGGTEEVLGAA
jgi:hypothetical protein